jgi:hypothetical protein
MKSLNLDLKLLRIALAQSSTAMSGNILNWLMSCLPGVPQ